MIRVNKGTAKISGEYFVLIQELSVLVRGMRKSGIRDKDLKEAFKVGLMSDEELDNAIKEQKEKLDKAIDELAEKIVKEILSNGREP